MGAKKSGEQSVRVISKNNSGTYQISLPIDLIRQLGWQQHQKIVVKKRGNSLIIVDWEDK